MEVNNTTRHRDNRIISIVPTKRSRDTQHRSKIGSEERSSSRRSDPRGQLAARMGTWSDHDSAAITNWISKLPPRSDEHSVALPTIMNKKKSCQLSVPPLANSAPTTPVSEEISTPSRKRKHGDIKQDHLEQAQKRTHQQNKHLTAEHREEEHLVVAHLGTGHVEAGNTVTDFQAEQFESSHLEPSEPEYFEMDEDRASVAGSIPSIMSNRPILEPKPPSRRSSRSTSSVRATLARLRFTAPPIHICHPGPAAMERPGEAVNKLKGFLLDGYDKAFIPRQLEVCAFVYV